MKPPILLLATCLAALALAGCSTTNTTELVKALATDTNQLQVIVSSPWGTVTINRNFRTQAP